MSRLTGGSRNRESGCRRPLGILALNTVHSGPMSNDMNNTESERVGPIVTDPVALTLIARATRARNLSRLGVGLLAGSIVIGFIAARITDGSPSSTLVFVSGCSCRSGSQRSSCPPPASAPTSPPAPRIPSPPSSLRSTSQLERPPRHLRSSARNRWNCGATGRGYPVPPRCAMVSPRGRSSVAFTYEHTRRSRSGYPGRRLSGHQ